MATGIPRMTSADSGGPGGSGDHGRLPGPAGGWTVGRVVTLVIGSVLTLVSLGLLAAGGTALWANLALRHDGYVTTGTATYSTTGYALAIERVSLHGGLLMTGLVGVIGVTPP